MDYLDSSLNDSIQGAIAELLVERCFRELGFFVIHLGEEHTSPAITQLADFISKNYGKELQINYGKNYKINYENGKPVSFDSTIMPMTWLSTMPDFAIVKDKVLELVEAKSRLNGDLWEMKDRFIFACYPQAKIVNLNFAETDDFIWRRLREGKLEEEHIKDLQNTYFHVWGYWSPEDDENPITQQTEEYCYPLPLNYWLEESCGIDREESIPIIKKYEKIAYNWLYPIYKTRKEERKNKIKLSD